MVSGNQDLSAALLGLRRESPANSLPLPSVPDRGDRWAGANPDPTPRTDAPPTANHHPKRGGEPDATSLAGGTPAPGRGGQRL
jgi:hypothetical protein